MYGDVRQGFWLLLHFYFDAVWISILIISLTIAQSRKFYPIELRRNKNAAPPLHRQKPYSPGPKDASRPAVNLRLY
jgi:hypothetical protein